MESIATKNILETMIFYHYFLTLPLPLIYLINLLTLQMQKNYATINKRIWYSMPLIFLLLSISFFGGLCVWAMEHFYFKFSIILMLLVFCILTGSEIYRIKRLKEDRISEASMKKYISLCKKLYSVNFILIVGLILGVLL